MIFLIRRHLSLKQFLYGIVQCREAEVTSYLFEDTDTVIDDHSLCIQEFLGYDHLKMLRH